MRGLGARIAYFRAAALLIGCALVLEIVRTQAGLSTGVGRPGRMHGGEWCSSSSRLCPFEPVCRNVTSGRSRRNQAGQADGIAFLVAEDENQVMGKGYAEGPAAEEAERRFEEIAFGPAAAAPEERAAVYGSTADDAERHFLGWLDEVDPDELFASGAAWGITVVRRAAH